jgi:hypothetical protein
MPAERMAMRHAKGHMIAYRALMADLVPHRVALIATPSSSGPAVTTRRSIHPDTPGNACCDARQSIVVA